MSNISAGRGEKASDVPQNLARTQSKLKMSELRRALLSPVQQISLPTAEQACPLTTTNIPTATTVKIPRAATLPPEPNFPPVKQKGQVLQEFIWAAQHGDVPSLKCLTDTYGLTDEDARAENNYAFRLAA